MSKIDDELTRRLRQAERPVDGDALFEGLERRRSHRERYRKVQAGLLAFAVLAATAGGFVALRAAFDGRGRTPGEPAPLPANGRIVFSSDVEEKGQRSVHLFSMEPDISAPMQLTEGYSGSYSPAVSPDGRTIAFTHELYNAQEVVIATTTIDGSPPTWLTDPALVASNPTWSPDGTRIAFTGKDRGTQRIFVMNADGSDPHPITGDGIFLPEDPAWSPDGTLIAFRASPNPPVAPEGPTTPDIFTIEPDGQRLMHVTESMNPESQPAWSPDGEHIAFTSSGLRTRGTGIVVRRLSDGTEVFLTDGRELDSDPIWSPDGRFIVFTRQPVANGRFDLWRVRADGSDPTRLMQDGYGASWQPIPRTTVTPAPVVSPSPEPDSRDIGLGFPLCDVQQLQGIDWYGDGTGGAAWTGARVSESGRCPSAGEGEYVVAADLDGDGNAEPGGMGFLEHCLFCRPFTATDLSGDGVLELVVLEEASSTPSYSIYEVSVPTSERSPGIYALFVAPPGAPDANLPADAPIRFIVGGDEGFSGGLRCENYPEGPVIVYTWFFGEVDADTDLQGHETRLSLGEDGIFHVLDTNDFTIRRDEPTNISTAPACGVDFHPAA